MHAALFLIATVALAAVPPTVAAPDFSGRWVLVAQETEAIHGRGAIGNHEEPVVIAQTATRLSIAVQSADPAGRFEYDLTGARSAGSGAGVGGLWTISRWDGTTLMSHGRRLFTTPDGPQAYDFTESRRLSADGARTIVRTRIDMFPQDLVRSSEYKRID